MEEQKITIKEVAEWLREHAPHSPRFIRLDLENGEEITWEIEPRTGKYTLKEEEE